MKRTNDFSYISALTALMVTFIAYDYDLTWLLIAATSYIAFWFAVQIIPAEKKPRGGNHETMSKINTERTINFEETQLK